MNNIKLFKPYSTNSSNIPNKINSNNKIRTNFNFQGFYELYKQYYPYNIVPSSEFLEWLIGMWEGDGNIWSGYVNKIEKTNPRNKFSISQSNLDKAVLEYVQSNLGFGSIYPWWVVRLFL